MILSFLYLTTNVTDIIIDKKGIMLHGNMDRSMKN